ncbi:hypothetical protein [Sorangium atrum]|uniref:Uncharacterized protein n=1 Tax=Sorangium atrum TaxID=2995308 RepID=A0ABT5C6D5_9BACT|nr:hypothetical protein [Sorangium aterium]MDC0681988.1 hypothetical protein [Sorangium aterium]
MSSTSQHDLDEAPEERPPEPETRPPWLRRLAPALLLLGALYAGSILFKRLPEEREVELRLDDAATVVRLDVTWTDSSSGDRADDAAPVIDSSWRFAEGTAPRAVFTKVSLPDGLYQVEITVSRKGEHDVTSRAVTLADESRITLFVH